MKDEFKVSIAQIDIESIRPEVNLDHILDTVDRIMNEDKVDLIVFPELANSGYIKPMDLNFAKDYVKTAEKIPGNFTKALGKKAKEYSVYIVTGILEAHPIIPLSIYNSAVLLSPDGDVAGIHRKMHLPGEEKHYFVPGNTGDVFQTELGNIGMLVCGDSSFPELARIMALKGAEIFCCCYNVPRIPDKVDFLKERITHVAACRSIENMSYFIGCDRSGNDAGGSYMGWSAITGPMGQVLARSETENEDIVRATFTQTTLNDARLSFGYFMMRRPEKYTLISEEIAEDAG